MAWKVFQAITLCWNQLGNNRFKVCSTIQKTVVAECRFTENEKHLSKQYVNLQEKNVGFAIEKQNKDNSFTRNSEAKHYACF